MGYTLDNEVSYGGIEYMSDQAILKVLGKFVKSKRLEQNVTQGVLSQKAGISRSTLSLLERGEPVALKTLVQVLRVLGQLNVLAAFVVKPEPSPMAIFKEESQKRKRARGGQGNNIPYESEW